jgi:hypothetical protein
VRPWTRRSVAALLCAVTFAAPVGAAERSRAVVLVQTGAAGEVAQLEASVRELVQRLGLELRTDATDALARVAVALGDAECTASITNRAGEVVAFRRVPRGPSSAVTLEAVAHVVQSAVEAVAELERAPPRSRPVVAEPSPPPVVVAPPVVAPVARRGLGLEVGALASGRGLGDGAGALFGGGVAVSLTRRGDAPWRPVGTFLATYTGPLAKTGERVQLSTQTVSLRLLGGARLVATERWALEVEAGGGADGLLPSATSTSLPEGAVRRSRVEVSPVLTAMVALRFAPTRATSLFLAASADVDLWPTRLVTDFLGRREVLFESWRVRPAVLLGFSFDVLAGER